MRVLMLGLDSSGKTSISQSLLNRGIDQVTPTLGFNIETIQWEGFNVDIWDIGGQSTLRAFWNNYFESTDVLIWVVDVADVQRLDESWKELESVLKCQGIQGSSLLIWINKIDLVGIEDHERLREQVIKGLNLDQLDNEFNVICCSALTHEGLKEGMNWMLNSYKEKYNL